MTKEKALLIMRLALGGKCGKLSIADISVYDYTNNIIIYYHDKPNKLKNCLDYDIEDTLEFSATPIRENWINDPIEICNATKVIQLFGEWKSNKVLAE